MSETVRKRGKIEVRKRKRNSGIGRMENDNNEIRKEGMKKIIKKKEKKRKRKEEKENKDVRNENLCLY